MKARHSLGLSLGVLCMCSAAAYSASCPGNESSLDRWGWIGSSSVHGVMGDHSLERCFWYPYDWPECYEEVELDGFDAYDELKGFGNRMERANCACNVDTAEQETTTSGSVTVTLGGENKETIQAQLGWPGVGSIGMGLESSVSWKVSGTYGGTYRFLTKDIQPDALEYWYKYYYLAHRQGREYDYVYGDVYDWCCTHGCWANITHSGHADYDGETATATIAEPCVDSSLVHDTVTPCSATPKNLNELLSNRPQTFGGGPSLTSGERFADNHP